MILAWIPFIEPARVFHVWWPILSIPLAWGIAMVYKAMRLESLDGYWRQVIVFTIQVVVGMAGMALALAILVQLIVPMLPVE